MARTIAVVLSRARDSSSQARLREDKILRGLLGRPRVELTVVPHLYDLAPDGPGIRRLRAIPGDMLVLAWLYPRATYWTLNANGIEGRLGPTFSLSPGDMDGLPERPAEPLERTIWCLDLRTHDRHERYVQQIERIADLTCEPAHERKGPPAASPSAAGDSSSPDEVAEAVRARWYPVVDFGRCTGCLECLNFCLFGVYGLGQLHSILVEQPDACRPGCPACSRICPQGAIMFPQHADPAIAGDPDSSLSGAKLDLSQLFRGADPAQLGAVDRDRAFAERKAHMAPAPQDADAAKNQEELDRLVDEVDNLDL